MDGSFLSLAETVEKDHGWLRLVCCAIVSCKLGTALWMHYSFNWVFFSQVQLCRVFTHMHLLLELCSQMCRGDCHVLRTECIWPCPAKHRWTLGLCSICLLRQPPPASQERAPLFCRAPLSECSSVIPFWVSEKASGLKLAFCIARWHLFQIHA